MIPKYVEKLLERRIKLAENLISVILELDDYSERNGIHMCICCYWLNPYYF